MRAAEIKAIPNITPGFPLNSTNTPCIKQSCKINPMILLSVFSLALLLVPLSRTLLHPLSKEPALLVIIPSSRFAHPHQLSWAGEGDFQEFP